MNKTLTYDQLAELWDKNGKGGHLSIDDLMKHFLVIALQNEATEGKIKALVERLDSMEGELTTASQTQSDLRKNIERQVMTQPNPKNPIEQSHKYQMDQGLLLPRGNNIHYNPSFANPEMQKAFLAAVHAIQFIEPDIEATHVFEFITM